MEKIAFFGTHSYDRSMFAEINEKQKLGFELINHRSFLDEHNAVMTMGAKAV